MRQLYEARLISVVIFVFKQCPSVLAISAPSAVPLVISEEKLRLASTAVGFS